MLLWRFSSWNKIRIMSVSKKSSGNRRELLVGVDFNEILDPLEKLGG